MSKSRGDQIELQAEQFLHQQGLQSLARNFHAAGGEIDLVMLDQQDLVFVEVRYRQHSGFGSAQESVDWRKQQRLVKAAQQFLQRHPEHQQRSCRFDVIACQPDNGAHRLQIDWIKQAFDAV